MQHEQHDLHRTGAAEHEVYDMEPVADDIWAAVTNVPCPVKDCGQTVVWYEANYGPGYRVCARVTGNGSFGQATIRHHFQARFRNSRAPTLIRHECCERGVPNE